MDPVLPVFLGVMGAAATITGYLDVRLAREVSTWPIVRGELLSAKLRRGFPGFGAAVAEVHYRYRVGSEVYTGHRFTHRRFRYYSEAERALYRVSDPGPVDVHYDPENPERAVLLPGAGYLPRMTVAFGLMSMAVALGLLILAAV